MTEANGSHRLTIEQVCKIQVLRLQRRVAELEAENSALTIRLIAAEERLLEDTIRRELGDQKGKLVIDIESRTVSVA